MSEEFITLTKALKIPLLDEFDTAAIRHLQTEWNHSRRAPLTTCGNTIIAPGASPGTIAINGSIVLGGGNTLTMEVGGLVSGTS